MKSVMCAAAVVMVSVPVFAHVGVTPRESKPGATETYTLRVPSEGGRTTTSLTLDVPDGVTVASVAAPAGATHEERRVDGRDPRDYVDGDHPAWSRGRVVVCGQEPRAGDRDHVARPPAGSRTVPFPTGPAPPVLLRRPR